MNVNLVRFEEVGPVFDFATQNAIVATFTSLCFVLIVVAFVVVAVSPSRDELSTAAWYRWRSAPIVIVTCVVVAFLAFFSTGVYRSAPFPKPQPTDRNILAQSAKTGALYELRARFGSSAQFDSGFDTSDSSVDQRSATPRTYTVRFHAVTPDAGHLDCTGEVKVGEPVGVERIAGARVDKLNPETGQPSNTYAPLTVTGRCSSADGSPLNG